MKERKKEENSLWHICTGGRSAVQHIMGHYYGCKYEWQHPIHDTITTDEDENCLTFISLVVVVVFVHVYSGQKNKLHNEILFNGKIHNKWTTQCNAQCIQTVHITNIIICIMGRAMAMNKLKINKKHSLSENINKCKFVRHSASTLFFWRYE